VKVSGIDIEAPVPGSEYIVGNPNSPRPQFPSGMGSYIVPMRTPRYGDFVPPSFSGLRVNGITTGAPPGSTGSTPYPAEALTPMSTMMSLNNLVPWDAIKRVHLPSAPDVPPAMRGSVGHVPAGVRQRYIALMQSLRNRGARIQRG
jgi:hypothetical protein